MKIEIILPDGAKAGTLTYASVENGYPYLTNVVLSEMEDGKLYDTTMEEGEQEKTNEKNDI